MTVLMWFSLGCMTLGISILLYKYILFEYIKRKVKLDYSATFSEIKETSELDVDRGFYEKVAGDCRKAEFRFIGNISESNHNYTFIALHSSQDGNCIVACYSFRTPENMADLDGKYSSCIDVSSETRNGEFLETSSAFEAGFIETSPKIQRECYPRKTELSELLARHLERINGRQDLVKLSTIQDIIDSANRAYQVSAEFRHDQGGRVKSSEIDRLQENLIKKLKIKDGK